MTLRTTTTVGDEKFKMEYFQAQDGKRYRYRKFTGFDANLETLKLVGKMRGGNEAVLGEYESKEELLDVVAAQGEAEEQGKSVFIFPPKGFSKSR